MDLSSATLFTWQLYGLKTHALLDVWTIEHIASGMSVGMISKQVVEKHLVKDGVFIPLLLQLRVQLLVIFLLSFCWEMVEHYLETGLAGAAVEYWFQGVEHWSNRLVSDHLAVLAGFFIFLKFPVVLWPARVFSIVWLVVHIFIFPHSMYLHELLH